MQSSGRLRPGFDADLENDRPGLPRHLATVGQLGLGLSMTEMAEKLGTTGQNLLNMRRGRRGIEGVVDAWAALVGVSLDDPDLERKIYYELLQAIDEARNTRGSVRDKVLLLDDLIRFAVNHDPAEFDRKKSRRTHMGWDKKS